MKKRQTSKKDAQKEAKSETSKREGRQLRKKGKSPPPPLHINTTFSRKEEAMPASLGAPPPVFIQAVSWSTFFLGDPETFTEPYIVVKSRFVFTSHGIKNCGVVPVYWLITVLFVGNNARVGPLLCLICFFVFL